MRQTTCAVDDCPNPGPFRRGWCQMHYVRWKKTGSTGEPPRNCPKGHKLTGGNVVIVGGRRRCAACLAARQPEPCTYTGCAEPAAARGWCRMHYLRWWRTGTPDEAVRVIVGCSVATCVTAAGKRGLCPKHYARWRRTGTTDDPPAKPLLCAYEGCDRAPCARGWCKKHHKQLTGQGAAHEMKRYALKRGSQVEPVSYERVIAVHGMWCHLCDKPIANRADLNIDHVTPLARGGAHTYENLRPAHKLCNQRKNDKFMSELVLPM